MARIANAPCVSSLAQACRTSAGGTSQEYPETTPVAVCYHLTWPDERIFRGELKDLARIVKENNLTLTTMIVVGEAIGNRKGLCATVCTRIQTLIQKIKNDISN